MKNVEQMIIGDPNGYSPTFKKFIKDVADSKTKYEEALVMQAEVENLKTEIKSPYATPNIQHERLVKLVYIHMLGYDATFGVIDAIKFAQQSSVFYKRVGYLVSSLLLDSSRQESLLLCCSLQKDLSSDSVVEQSMALTVICQLMGRETISLFIPTIIRKLSHPKEIIRKKAVDVMYQFLCEQPDQRYDERYQIALCDPDAGVMISTLAIYLKLTKEDPDKYRHMIKAFTDILNQIVEGRLHASFNYHTFPAPWAQVYLLQILQHLGTNNKQCSDDMSQVLHMVVARASGKMTTPQASDAAVAVLYQVSLTILSIYPNQDLILLVTRKIDELLNSAINKVYLGLKLLHKLCEQQPAIGTKLVNQVYDYTRLYTCSMIREAAVHVICVGVSPDSLRKSADVLLDVLADEKSTDTLKSLCCESLADMGRRHSPNTAWYAGLLIEILNKTTSTGGGGPSSTLTKLVNYCTTSLDADVERLVQLAANESDNPASQLSWLSIWALGRYDTDFIKAAVWCERLGTLSDDQRLWLFDSLIVLVTRLGSLPDTMHTAILPYTNDPSPLIRQIAVELVNISDYKDPTILFTADAITQMISQLSEDCTDVENTLAHKQFLKKFRKRASLPPDRVDFEVNTEEEPQLRTAPPAKDGTRAPTTGWISYHEHMPEEPSNSDKPEPPLSQPALRNTNRWRTGQSHSGDQARC